MNPYQFKVTCSICEEEGIGTSKTDAAAWDSGSYIIHTDPTVCADNLAWKREKQEEMERNIPQEAYGG